MERGAEISRVRGELEVLERAVASQTKALEKHEESRGEAERSLETSREALTAAEEAAGEVDRAALSAESSLLSTGTAALTALGEISRSVAGAARRAGDARSAARDDARLAGESEAGAALAEREAGEQKARVAELTKAREQALSERGFSAHRAALVPGAPCPLCGSKEHPWGVPGGEPDDPTAALARELAEAAKLERDAVTRAAGHRGTAAAARKAVAERELAAKTADAEIAELARSWRERVSTLAEGDALRAVPAEAEEIAAAAPLVELGLASSRARQGALRQGEERAAALESTRETARKTRDEAASRLAAVSDLLRTAEKALGESRQAATGKRTALEGFERERRRLIELLSTFSASGPAATEAAERELLETNPAALRAAWESRVASFLSREVARASATGEIHRLSPLSAAAAAHQAQAAIALAAREADASALGAALEELRALRGALLGGRSVKEVSEHLEAAVALAEKEQAARTGRLSEAREKRAAAEASLEAAGRAEAEAKTKAAESGQERDAAFAGLALPAGAPSDAVAAERDAAARNRETARKEQQDAEILLREDDRVRQERLQAEADRNTALARGRVWRELRDLIGSADGAGFRKFAQGLTLRMLVDGANRHLADLARRYQLALAEGTDMGLVVVDRDMGDETRSVESLSGGESFLVSLALALGLASLATRTTSIGSLFIDEGFGSLDPDTLDRAIAALDVLQSKGRRIGVISHVQAMSEKIGVQVKVVAKGGGRSEVRVVGA